MITRPITRAIFNAVIRAITGPSGIAPAGSGFLMESAGYILMESGDKILLEA